MLSYVMTNDRREIRSYNTVVRHEGMNSRLMPEGPTAVACRYSQWSVLKDWNLLARVTVISFLRISVALFARSPGYNYNFK